MTGIYLGSDPASGHRTGIFYNGDRHVLCFGPSGSGKSVRFLLQNLILTATKDIFQSAVVIDPKGELAAMTANYRRKHGRVVIVNPFNVQVKKRPDLKSDGFNPLASIDPKFDVEDPDEDVTFTDDATSHAEAIIRIEGKDPHFPASAQDLWTALTMWARMGSLGSDATPIDVRRMLTAPSQWHTAVKKPKSDEPDPSNDDDDQDDSSYRRGEPKSGLVLTALEMMESGDEVLMAKGARFLKSSRELDGIVSTAATQTRFLDSEAMKRDMTLYSPVRRAGVDFADLKRENLTVYVILPANRLRSHSSWLRIVIDSALRAMYDTPNANRPPVNFFIDECASLGNLPILEDAVGLIRAFQGRLILCWQDANQLNDLYERRFQSFFANAGAVLAFPPRDMFTAKHLSDLTGQRTAVIKTPTTTTSTTRSNGGASTTTTNSETPSLVQQPMWRPEELMQLPEGQALSLMVGQPPMIIPVPSYQDMPEFVPHIDENPYHPRHP